MIKQQHEKPCSFEQGFLFAIFQITDLLKVKAFLEKKAARCSHAEHHY